MTTHYRTKVSCACGHMGEVHQSENDQPYSKQWENYSITGFDGDDYYIEGFASLEEAIQKMRPKCPSCGAIGLIKAI